MTLSNHIRRLRMERKLSQGDLEKATGLRRQYISRVENGRTVPSLETLEKLAAALAVPLYRMFYQGAKLPAKVPKRLGMAEARYPVGDAMTNRLLRLVARVGDSDRQLLLHTVRKMAQLQRARAPRQQDIAAD